MANGKKQHKNPVRKVETHKVTSGAAGKKKAAAERLNRADKVRRAAAQAILAKKEAEAAVPRPAPVAAPQRLHASKAQQRRVVAASSSRLMSASSAIHAVAAATLRRQEQLV